MKTKKIIPALIIIFLGLGVLWYLNTHSVSLPTDLGLLSGTTHSIILTKDGFVPNEISINLGDALVFTTQLSQAFWPASDPHPIHEIYQEFDPNEPIEPGKSWQYAFNREGVWLYHNHLNPGNFGKVTVVDRQSGNTEAVFVTKNCLLVPKDQKLPCWDTQLKDSLKFGGLDFAFDSFKAIYKTEPDVPKACHEWGHILGEAAYGSYKEGQTIKFRDEMGFCGYGFFHGFLKKLVEDTGNPASARAWCESLVSNVNNSAGAWQNCIHGVGHGTTAWLLDEPSNWGNFQKVADSSLAFCDKVFNINESENCYDGIFNELHLDILNSLYGMDFNDFVSKKDPYFYCSKQEDRFKRSCYFEFVGIFYKLFDFDLEAAMEYVVKNTDDLPVRGPSVIGKLAADFMQFDIVKDDWKRNLEACRNLPKYLFESCLSGIINGFVQHGEPESMHTRALSFCAADYLNKDEQSYCYNRLVGQFRAIYSPKKMLEVCQLVDPAFKVIACNEFSSNEN